MVRVVLENTTDVPIYLASISLAGVIGTAGDQMTRAGWGVIGAGDGRVQRPILLGFGEQLTYTWLEIAPHQKVWASWVLIPPFGAPVKLEESSISRTGGSADFHAQVSIDPSLGEGIGNVDLGVITAGLGQLTVTDDAGVRLEWTHVAGARAYRVYRSQDRYSWSREDSFLVELVASGAKMSFLDTSTTGTPGEPQAYFYAIETVFGPNVTHPDGESHVLHPVTPVVDRNGLFARTPELRAIASPTATVTITDPLGNVIVSVLSGPATERVQLALISGAALADGEYTITVTSTRTELLELSVSGNGAASDAFGAHIARLALELGEGKTRSYRVLFDRVRGIVRIWLVDSPAPRVDRVDAPAALYGDAPAELTVRGANLSPASVFTLGGRTLTVVRSIDGGVVVAVPYGLAAGWHDLVVENADGSTGRFYGAVRAIEALDLAVQAPERVIGDAATFGVFVRNAPAGAQLSYRLDGGAPLRLDGSSLTLSGLTPGWHLVSFELGAWRRDVAFQVLPPRTGAWPQRPAPAGGPLTIVSGSATGVTISAGGLPPGALVAVLVDGRDGTLVRLPTDQFALAGLGPLAPGLHTLTVRLVDERNRPLGPQDQLYFWVTATGRRVVIEGAPVAAPGQAVVLPFRIVRANGMPEYHFGATDQVATSLGTTALDDLGAGALTLTGLGPGSHRVVVGGAEVRLTVINDADGDGLLNGALAELDTDGDGIPNAQDVDMDGDGRINSADRDTDGDLVLNAEDADIDGDGLVNAVVDCLPDGTEVVRVIDPDIDGDGLANEIDADADGDGVNDPGDADRYGARSVLGRMTTNAFERRSVALVIEGPAVARARRARRVPGPARAARAHDRAQHRQRGVRDRRGVHRGHRRSAWRRSGCIRCSRAPPTGTSRRSGQAMRGTRRRRPRRC